MRFLEKRIIVFIVVVRHVFILKVLDKWAQWMCYLKEIIPFLINIFFFCFFYKSRAHQLKMFFFFHFIDFSSHLKPIIMIEISRYLLFFYLFIIKYYFSLQFIICWYFIEFSSFRWISVEIIKKRNRSNFDVIVTIQTFK